MSKNKANQQIISPPSSNPAPVPMITIDGVAYGLAELSDTTKQQLGNVRLVDQELAHLHTKSLLAQAARAAFAQGVKRNLPKRAPASSGA